jgi:FkbM family methyltransferase
MLRPINKLTNFVKFRLVEAGLYRPGRFLVDHLIDRRRIHDHQWRRNFYRQMIAPGELCFDVGANIGDYTDALMSIGAKVVAVDPQPSCIKELRARFRRNDRVTVVPVAVGETEGAAKFFLRKKTVSSGFIEEWDDQENAGSIQVPVKTLDQLISSYGRPKYIKIDVEGYELPTFKGLNSKIDLISFEYHLSKEDCAEKLQIINNLKRFGDLRIAILGEGDRAWTMPWQNLNDFLTVFPDGVPKTAFLGDIFVQIT